MFSSCLTPMLTSRDRQQTHSCDSARGQTKLTDVDDCTEFDEDRLSGCQVRAPKTSVFG